MEWLIFLTKAIVLLLSLAFVLVLKARLRINALRVLFWLIVWALLRDFVFVLVPSPAVAFIGDVGIYSFLFVWLRYYTGPSSYDRIFVLIALASLAVGLALVFNSRLQSTLLFLTLNIALLLFLFIAMGAVSDYNTKNAEIVVDTRGILLSSLGLLAFIGSVTEYEAHAGLHIATVLFYFTIWFILLTEFQLYHLLSELTIAGLHRQNENLFEFMEALGGGITDRKDISGILHTVVRSAAKTIEADGAVIMMLDEEKHTLKAGSLSGFYPPPYPVPEVVKHRSSSVHDYLYSREIPIGETILGESAAEAKPIFIPDSSADSRLSGNVRKDHLFIRSFIAVPLTVGSRTLGVISAVRRNPDHPFSEEDFDHVKTFARHAAITIDNFYTYLEVLEKREMQREISIAADIQNKLTPSEFPVCSGVDIAVHSKPARGVSGDFYDVMSLDDETLGIVIGDVAGKGVPAALVMVMIHTILRLVAAADREVGTTLSWINSGLSGQIDLEHYATMSYLTLNCDGHRVTYSNAAHHPLMVLRHESGETEEVDTEGIPVGIEPSISYSQKTVSLARGDVMVLYTDGIIEAMNLDGRQFGIERLEAIIQAHNADSASGIAGAVRDELAAFVGNAQQHDDQTFMVLRVST